MIRILREKNEIARYIAPIESERESVRAICADIIASVRKRGDEALFGYTEKFDGLRLSSESVVVSESEIKRAYEAVDPDTISALVAAKKNIESFHLRYLPASDFTKSSVTGRIIRAVKRAGIYVPGGKAAYPSTVLMCAVPAIVAGVEEIIMATPGREINPLSLVAAAECGIKKIFRIGGAQAIAALAYGTESVPRVDVITGPGNIFVATAKREVYGDVGIDSIAGPSEITVIADDSASAEFVAADMLSQAEHDELARSILITTDDRLAGKVSEEIVRQMSLLSRREIATASIANRGAIILVNSIEEAFALSDEIAPEHLELCIKSAEEKLNLVRNAGAVFIGNYSPEPLGDYFAGPNHVLPTSGTARFASALDAECYLKKINVIKYDRNLLSAAGNKIIGLATAEGLTAHARAVERRLK